MSDGDIGGLFTLLVALALLALIPATIAKQKGREFGQWWFYGILFLPIALIHSTLLDPLDDRAQRQRKSSVDHSVAVADAIAKFAILRNDGLISEEEFQQKRQELLGDPSAQA